MYLLSLISYYMLPIAYVLICLLHLGIICCCLGGVFSAKKKIDSYVVRKSFVVVMLIIAGYFISSLTFIIKDLLQFIAMSLLF